MWTEKEVCSDDQSWHCLRSQGALHYSKKPSASGKAIQTQHGLQCRTKRQLSAIKWQLNKMVAPCMWGEGACCEVPLGEQDREAYPIITWHCANKWAVRS